MNLYTTYFSRVRALPETIVPISIALWPPQGWNYPCIAFLAPPRSLLTKYRADNDWNAYVDKYQSSVLDKYKPEAVVQHIMELTGGKDAALVCYERPEKDCHRHLVADWLQKAGYHIKEWSGEM